MISNVDKDQIIYIWSVTVGNKLIENFIILLANGSHYYSCLSLNNSGIICRADPHEPTRSVRVAPFVGITFK
jgi:hypothetical protein